MMARGGLFSLLGILVDADGERATYIHNQHVRMQTTNFGTCYISGSGTPLFKETTADVDTALSSNGGGPRAILSRLRKILMST
jgi:hypothetical protein